MLKKIVLMVLTIPLVAEAPTQPGKLNSQPATKTKFSQKTVKQDARAKDLYSNLQADSISI
jgi:hypothetical protein